MRSSRHNIRRLLAVAPAAMLIGLGALIAACGNNESPSPSSTTTTTTPTTSTTAPVERTGIPDGEEPQPHRRKPVHSACEGRACADGTSWRAPQQVIQDRHTDRTDMLRLRRPRDWMALVGGVVLIALGGLTAACSTGNEAPSSTTTTTTTTTTTPPSSAPASPTEKSIDPSGGNLFTPKWCRHPRRRRSRQVSTRGSTGVS